MTGLEIAALASLAAGTIGSISGGSGDTDEYIQKALAQYEGIIPPDLAKAIVYTQFQQGGQLTPQQLAALPIEAQEAIKLVESPEGRQRQTAQLQALEQLAQSGMGAQERLALEESRLKAAQSAQARQAGLLQKYAQMGQGGGPASLAAQLSGLQQSSQDEMLGNLRAAAMQQENRRAAIQAALSGAEKLRSQDFSTEQSNVEAQRQRQIFDIQNQLARQRTNAEMAQQANIMNLKRQQDIMDRNIAMQNQELYRRKYLAPQQMYENQMDLARARAGAYGQRANIEQQRAEARAKNWMNLGLGGAQVFGSLGKTGDRGRDSSGGSNLGYVGYSAPDRFSLGADTNIGGGDYSNWDDWKRKNLGE